MTVRVVLVCVAAAMICAAIRLERPELAMGVSLAVGIGVVLFILDERQEYINIFGKLSSLACGDSDLSKTVVKAAGIALISEMGVQICSDAGESALAGRISLASRITMAGLCCPILERMLELLQIFE